MLDAAGGLVADTRWTYNARGQVLTESQVDPATGSSRTTTTTYCEQTDVTAGTCPLIGLVTRVDGPRTDVVDTTTHTYYSSDDSACAAAPAACPHRRGDPWKVTNALGQVTEYLRYDGAGRVLSVKDPNGVITDFEYHPRGWLTARKVRGTDAGSETDDVITRIEYLPTGLVQRITQPDGAFTTFTYDTAHRLTDVADGVGNSIHYTLDNAGNRTREDTRDAQGALVRTLSRVFNQLGELQTQTDAYGHATLFTYDADARPDATQDPLGRVTDQDHDPLGRLSRILQDANGLHAETTFAYDARDNLTRVTDPKGLQTSYVYNGFGERSVLSSPDTGTTDYTYDSAGNMLTERDARGIAVSYRYDALSRLISTAYSDGTPGVAYTYDASVKTSCGLALFGKGRLTRMDDAAGRTEYCYDRFGRLTRQRHTINGRSYSVDYRYTPSGQLSGITYPDGAQVDYLRDAQGRVGEVGVTTNGGVRQVLLTAATHHPFGPVAGWVGSSGQAVRRTLNQNYQQDTIISTAPGGLSLGYGYDAVGKLVTLRTGAGADPPLARYVMDGLDRLTEVQDGPTGTTLETYAYDATGNRLSVTHAGLTSAYVYPADSHRLTAVGAQTRSYDAAGHTTGISGPATQIAAGGGGTRSFRYDGSGRLVQATTDGVELAAYSYDGQGRQVRRRAGGVETVSLLDAAGHWLGDYSSSGTAQQQAIWLDDLPVGLLVGAGATQRLHAIEADALGTPRVVLDPSRAVAVWRWPLTGEAFGATVADEDADRDGVRVALPLRFPGQRYDAATGLHQNGFRDYEPQTGRYMQSDPIGLLGDLSTYAYAEGAPISKFDPLGLKACENNKELGCDEKKLLLDTPCAGACNGLMACRQCCQKQHIEKCTGKIKGWRRFLPTWYNCGRSDFGEAAVCTAACDAKAGI